ncbi:hypothetical protein JCM6882_005222 [Rhodosporidiobolus microsporus]
MSTRIKHQRTAAATVSYAEQLGSSSEDEGDEVGPVHKSKGGRVSKGKGGVRSRTRDEDSEEDSAPKAKKRKTGKGKGKAREKQKPKKDYLRTMPMDVLVEIFSHLHPGELLQLSRTAKEYRSLLTDQSAKPIWRRSRRLVKLPDFDAPGMTEQFYAQLVFVDRCGLCDKLSNGRPDFYLRCRLCSACRADNLVRINNLGKTHPEYHPATAHVVRSTPHPPSSASSVSKSRYALKSDLDFYSKELEQRQLEDDIASDAKLGAGKSRTTRRRSSARQEEDPSSAEETAGVVEGFVEEREILLEAMSKAANVVDEGFESARVAVACLRHNDSNEIRTTGDAVSGRRARLDRLYCLQELVAAETGHDPFGWEQGFKKNDLVDKDEPLTVEEWDNIKVDVCALAEDALAAKAAREEEREKKRAWEQVQDLRDGVIRSRYNALRAREKDAFLRSTFPLLGDFLLFESVGPLRLPKDRALVKTEDYDDTDYSLLDAGAWEAALPLIEEELAQYRLELLLHATKLILSSTTDDDLPDDDEILANLDKYDDAFFDRAAALLCCALPACAYRSGTQNGAFWWLSTRGPPTVLGHFLDVLEHAHSKHSDHSCKDAKAPFPFDRPPEVACALSALCKVGDLPFESATVEELDALDARGRYEWENAPCRRHKYNSWSDLILAVWEQARRRDLSKTRCALDPPSIVYRRRRDPLLPPA